MNPDSSGLLAMTDDKCHQSPERVQCLDKADVLVFNRRGHSGIGMKSTQTTIIAGLLLSMLLLPQLVLAEEVPEYSVRSIPASGFYNRTITVWVTVAQGGRYYVCWDAWSSASAVATIDAPASGNFSASFAVPEAKRGEHTLYLTDDQFGVLAEAAFSVDPTTSLNPRRGPVGTEVIINGYGFTANEANIPIKCHGSQVDTATADDKGSWEVSYIITNMPAGDYLFEVGPDREPDEECMMCMCFTVTPEIKVTPASGVSGQIIDISGTGFAENEKGITVAFDEEVVKENISADANGSWSANVPIPRRASGTYIIDASGFSTWARDVPDVTFKVETGVWVEPGSAQVGDEVVVTASGFAAWETGIKVTFDGRALDTGTIAVDRYGTWEASFVLPTSTYGPHSIGAYGVATKAADVKKATLNTLARLEVAPAEASPGDSVILTGSGFPGDQALTVTFANRAVRENVRSLADGNLSATVTVPANPAATVLVTASDGGAQASTDFTVIAKVLPTPHPVSPEADRTFRSRDISFEWGRITAGSNVTITYSLEIIGPGGSHRFSDIQGLTHKIPRDEALPKGDYRWQVKAIDEFGNESLWSDPIPFRVSPIPTWTWVIVGLVVFTTLMVVAYREGKLKVIE